MFSKVIGKKCKTDPASCRLSGQLQDTGLVICPDCGNDLIVETVSDKRAQLALIVALALIGALIGITGYGFVAKRLNPLQTAEWLVRRIQLGDSVLPADAQAWIQGGATFYNESDALPLGRDQFLYQVKDGRRTSTFRAPLAARTTMQMDVQSVAPGVSSLYVFHRGDTSGRLLHASMAPIAAPLVIPAAGKRIRLEGAAATEHFVLVAAKKPLPGVEKLVSGATATPDGVSRVLPAGELDSAITPLEQDPETFVLHVFIPHS
jgi:hypothetical protein